MSIDYLMKKVWHPGSMKNVQVVWEKQQEEKDRIRKAQEMRTKLEEEKHHEEIRRLQVKAGQIPASQLDRLDWMYQWKGHAQKTAEQYLLGKKIAESKPQKQVKHVTKQQITNQMCEDFFKVHEDPLYMIKLQQVKARKALQNNPTKMKQIYETIEYRPVIKKRQQRSQSQSDSSREKRRKQKKEKKQKKQKKQKKSKKDKHKKHRKHSRSRSESSSRSRSNRNRSPSLEKTHSKKSTQTIVRNQQKSQQLKEQRKQYNQFLKQKYGAIAQQDQNGRVKLNFNKFRSKYQTQHQLSQRQKQQSRQRMMRVGKQVYDETINN